MIDPLTTAHRAFADAAAHLSEVWEAHPDAPESDAYPFARSFREVVVDIIDWRDAVAEYLGDPAAAGTPGPRPEAAGPARPASATLTISGRTARYFASPYHRGGWHVHIEVTGERWDSEIVADARDAVDAIEHAISGRWGFGE